MSHNQPYPRAKYGLISNVNNYIHSEVEIMHRASNCFFLLYVLSIAH